MRTKYSLTLCLVLRKYKTERKEKVEAKNNERKIKNIVKINKLFL